MRKTTFLALSALSITALTLATTLTHADSIQYNELNDLNVGIESAAIAAAEAAPGKITEIELEMEDAVAVWEVDVVNNANQLIKVTINGQSGEVLSTQAIKKIKKPLANVVSLSQAIDIANDLELGAIVEAELEHEKGSLIWEIESITSNNKETEIRIDANTGEVLI